MGAPSLLDLNVARRRVFLREHRFVELRVRLDPATLRLHTIALRRLGRLVRLVSSVTAQVAVDLMRSHAWLWLGHASHGDCACFNLGRFVHLAQEASQTARARIPLLFVFFDGAIESFSLLEDVVLDQDPPCLDLLPVRRCSLQLLLFLCLARIGECAGPVRGLSQLFHGLSLKVKFDGERHRDLTGVDLADILWPSRR